MFGAIILFIIFFFLQLSAANPTEDADEPVFTQQILTCVGSKLCLAGKSNTFVLVKSSKSSTSHLEIFKSNLNFLQTKVYIQCKRIAYDIKSVC